MSGTVRPFGLDHLTMLDTSPPELVRLAAAAGFAHVGLRIHAMDATEQPWPMAPGSPMLAETIARRDDTGTSIPVIEVLLLDEHTDIAAVEPYLQVGAVLGASILYVVGQDPDLDRLADRFAALTTLALTYGIRPVVEPMAYRPVCDLATAVSVASRSQGGGVLVDALHLLRSGGTAADVATTDPVLLPVAQLCDATARVGAPPPDAVAARGQSADVPPLQWEARVGRLLPGEGALPLAEVVRALPARTLLALEAPNFGALREHGPERFLAEAARRMDLLLTEAQS
ncbi:sugar phosphate isomerase/epimerase [Micromonospora sonneratiae]|uniref:Sugar phosphate isomerase/epimerase family protein n=1 Tax=Micromonospora sonneratiae TaxID=1184706 RepID=A0ABW3YJG0_9ACTN